MQILRILQEPVTPTSAFKPESRTSGCGSVPRLSFLVRKLDLPVLLGQLMCHSGEYLRHDELKVESTMRVSLPFVKRCHNLNPKRHANLDGGGSEILRQHLVQCDRFLDEDFHVRVGTWAWRRYVPLDLLESRKGFPRSVSVLCNEQNVQMLRYTPGAICSAPSACHP